MADGQNDNATTAAAGENPGYTVQKREGTRWWEVVAPGGELVCLTVYRRGANEVVRRLSDGQSG